MLASQKNDIDAIRDMNVDINNIKEFEAAAAKCDSLDELKCYCEDFSSQVTFEYYLFGVIDATSLSSPRISTITNYPDGWWSVYFKDKMQKSDPVVKYCFEKSAPIRWDKLVEMKEFMSPEAESMMSRSSEFGLSYGTSIPVKSPSGEVAIFSLASPNDEDIDNRFAQLLAPAQSICHTLLETYIRLKAKQDDGQIHLTPRETECLFWACEGKTAWEISKIIDISERTVIFHMTSATKKLGATNRQHAVAKAIIYGLIKPVP